MSTPHTGSTNGDHDADPTGMRDVLGSLSDPAPMPQQLADRIYASLAEEQQARVGAMGWQSTAGSEFHDGVTHDFAAEKAHRRPQQWILAAAAVVAVGVIGTVILDQFVSNSPDPSSVAAQANPKTSNGDSADAKSRSDDSDSGNHANEPEPQADAAASGDDGSGSNSLESLGDSAFALGAQALLSSTDPENTGDDIPNALSLPESLNVEVGNVAPLDAADLGNCAQAAGESSGQSWRGLTATINGEEVVVLGNTDSDSPVATQVWAIDSSCPQNASAAVLKGPVELP